MKWTTHLPAQRRSLIWLAVAFLALVGPASAGPGGEHALSYDLAAAKTRLIREYRIAVDDVPRHELRLFDLERTFTVSAPAFAGIRVVASQEQGTSDLVDQNGVESGYVVYLLEDGNRVFGRYRGTVQTRRWPDGSRHYDIRGTIELTGGSGRLAAIRGTLRVWQALDPGADSSQGGVDGTYRLTPR